MIFLSSITTGLESLNLFRVQFSASINALAAASFLSLHIISNSKCCFATSFSHFTILSFNRIDYGRATVRTSLRQVDESAGIGPLIPDLVRLQFDLFFFPSPLSGLQSQIGFANAPFGDRQFPVTDFVFVALKFWLRVDPGLRHVRTRDGTFSIGFIMSSWY